MKAFTKICTVCGVSCAIAAHAPHHYYSVGGSNMEPLSAVHQLHPEQPEPGDYVRAPQVAAVTTPSAMPPGRFIFTEPQYPTWTPDTFIFPNVALRTVLADNAPTAVSSNSQLT